MTHFFDKHIIIFTRYPEPGKTKTRLIPALGAVGAADLHRRIAEQTINKASRFSQKAKAGIEICYEGGDDQKVRTWLGADLNCRPQSSGNIGQRMQSACEQGFAKGAKQIVLVGTDIPHISESSFQKAFEGLSHNDVVLGPSTDGGYWLIGLNKSQEIFTDISWSTPAVLRETMDRCGKNSLRVHQLDPMTDVDTIEDLNAVMPNDIAFGPYISVIIPALNESQRIRSAIESAEHEAAEIIVVDGGSTDSTVEQALSLNVKVLNSNKGRAIQQNAGTKVATGQVFLFLHADTVLPKNYVEFVFETLLNPKTILGAFQFKTSLDTTLIKIFEFVANIRSTVFNRPYGDQCIFIKCADFKRVGGFPDVPVAEDLMLVCKLSQRGKIGIAPAKAVTSGRRWENIGTWKTFLINQAIAIGYAMGFSPDALAALYQRADRKLWRKNNMLSERHQESKK